MTTGVQVKRVTQPSVRAHSSTQRSAITAGSDARRTPRVSVRTGQDTGAKRVGRRKVGG